MIVLSHKKQGFTFFLENIILRKPHGGQIEPLPAF